jgi:hypothetical protein
LEYELTKVRVTSGDSTPDFLNSKIVAGTNVSISVIGSSGSNQALRISSITTGGSGSSSLSISGSYGSTNYLSSPATVLFDDATGFQVQDIGDNTAKITIASHFKNIVVSGQSTLVATGSDTFEIIGDGGLAVTTSLVDTNSSGVAKELRIDATDLSSSLSSRISTLETAPAGVSSHASLTDLSWASSSHIANAHSLPAFGPAGQAITVLPPADGSRTGKTLQWISNDTLGWVTIAAAVSFAIPSLGVDSFDTVEYAAGVITIDSFDIVIGSEGAP